MIAIVSIVVWAFFHSGGLKAGTPFATASVPVIAEQPSAKARITSSSPSDSGAIPAAGVTPVTCGASPRTVRMMPTRDQGTVRSRKR